MRSITSTRRVPLAISGLLVAAGTTAGAVLPTTASAMAPSGDSGGGMTTMSCSHSWSNKDADYGHVDADWLRRRSGPHTSCTALGQAARGTRIYYHCYVGIWPNSWTHGRIAGTNQNGWFADRYLTDDGSVEPC
jgi:hypothetical protein